MPELKLTAFCLAILMLAGCTQTTTAPAKAAADKPATPVSQPVTPDSGSRGGDGGGGY